jgi:hypothetical protein
MREETIRCNDCGEIVKHNILVLEQMVVTHIKRVEPLNEKIQSLVGPGATEKGKTPDFCGVPCMLKWISSKLNGGTKGGDAI